MSLDFLNTLSPDHSDLLSRWSSLTPRVLEPKPGCDGEKSQSPVSALGATVCKIRAMKQI